MNNTTTAILTILATALMASCTAQQRAAWPVAIGIKRDGVDATYSPKGGLMISIDNISSK